MKQRITRKIKDTLLDELKGTLLEHIGDNIVEITDNETIQDALEEIVLESIDSAARDLTERKETNYANVYEFVEQFLSRMYPYAKSHEQQLKWTPRWWAHEEAVVRLTALWNRYEQLRLQEPATHVETFLRVHADYHMRVLMADGGVFDASRREDQPSIPLPTAPVQPNEGVSTS